MAGLSGAHHGYIHQDVVTAYALATLLLPRAEHHRVTIDKKVIVGDCFDDLELIGLRRSRVQVKAHEIAIRPLQLNDFTTNAISFRLDNAIRSFGDDAAPADEYRLFATYDLPEEALLQFLQPTPSTPPVFPGLSTQRFCLKVDAIWPEGRTPAWPHIEELGRETVAIFCDRFVIEVGCPRITSDLRSPGPLEKALLALLHDHIGVGIWPNDNRDLADTGAQLIYTAINGRRKGTTLDQNDVIKALALTINYGRVDERFPVDERRLVTRAEAVDDIIAKLSSTACLAVTGPPGFGKSWLLKQLASKLTDSGWVVGVHYCFVDILDVDRSQRASVETTFGSIMAELYDADPSLATESVPRYAAGLQELERLLDNAARQKPDRRIALIVDGLDHVDRVPGRSTFHAAAEIAEYLASLRLPPGVVLIVGSQPGDHLRPILEVAQEYRLERWPSLPIRLITERMDVPNALREVGLEGDIERVIETIIEKAHGSPLYASYLARTAVTLAHHVVEEYAVSDIAEYLSSVPKFDEDIDRYYEWLVVGYETGVLSIAELLSFLDFPVTTEELGEIRPEFQHHLLAVLSRLAPVLTEDVIQGGVRIHHESFQRYVRGRLEKANASIPAVLLPAINWLHARGFFRDGRAFRSLLGLLKIIDRNHEIVSLIADDFVAQAAANGQPADAVMGNLATAGLAAAALQDWVSLARLVELSRAANNLYSWRLDDHDLAEEYGRAYAALFGPKALADRLLHDGRCTFRPRAGLILCQLCDEQGALPPWKEYQYAHALERRISNTSYGQESEVAIKLASHRGCLRVNGRERGIRECIEQLSSPDSLDVHPADAAFLLGDVYGAEALVAVIESLHPGKERAWARVMLAQLLDDRLQAKSQATAAVQDGLSEDGWGMCLRLGVAPQLFPRDVIRLHELTVKVLAPGVEFHRELLSQWLTELELAAATGDDTSLTGVHACIPSDTWFRKWLRFRVTLFRQSLGEDELVSVLQDLSENIEVFQGSPRVCDLYGLHRDIQRSFQYALVRLDDRHWSDAIAGLGRISTATTTWVQQSRSGPLTVNALFEICLATANTDAKRQAASALGSQFFAPGRQTHELYDTHAQDHLLLARIHARSGQRDPAEKAWLEACRFLASYGYRKDITVYELLDPLETLAVANSARVRRCLSQVQPIVERVLNHTDGKETRYAIHNWLDYAAQAHPAGALSYIAHDQIGRELAFGGFDHVLTKALMAMEDQLDPSQVLAGWIASGSEARSQPGAALLAAEKARAADRQIGDILWNSMVSILDGDGVGPVEGLAQLVKDSSLRLGKPAPPITFMPPTGEDKTVGSGVVRQQFRLDQPPFLPANALALQISHELRRWHRGNGPKADPQRMVNAVGWRLVEMLQAGQVTSVESLIRRLASDTPGSWEQEWFLSGIAEGLARYDYKKLAALAMTCASTRALDGWLRLGSEAQRLFQSALGFDYSVAWSTYASEVAETVVRGGGYGVTAQLIKLLAAGGLQNEAFAAWDAACRAVTFRVPATGPHDECDPLYDDQCDNSLDMLAAAVVARMNNCLIHEKRLAIAATALFAHQGSRSLANALQLAVAKKAPASTLITFLHVLKIFEPSPYEVTHAADAALRIIAESDLVSARVLARELLKRAGLSAPATPPSSTPVVSFISHTKAATLIKHIGTHWVTRIEEIWPDFGRYVAACADTLLRSEDLKERMQSALRRVGPYRKGSRVQLWFPAKEQIQRILQTTGASVRAALAQEGILDDRLEDEVGSRLLGELPISIRRTFSRTVRPTHLPCPTELSLGEFTAPLITVPVGEFAGWVIAAHHETELVIGDEYPHPIVARSIVYSGVELGGVRRPTDLPLSVGNPSIWTSGSLPTRPSGRFLGPLSGLAFVSDIFGPVEILVPPPVLVNTLRLVPAPFYCGLSLLDPAGGVAVVCRTWRQRYVDEKEPAGEEPRLTGLQLLLRPDVFEAVSALAAEPAAYVTVVTNEAVDGGDSFDE